MADLGPVGILHGRKPGLLAQFALMSLLPIAALGLVLARDLRHNARGDALREARRVTQSAGNLAIGQTLTPADIRNGIGARKIALLDRSLHRDLSGVQVVRIKVWSPRARSSTPTTRASSAAGSSSRTTSGRRSTARSPPT